MFEENEISINANGGTELAKRHLARLLPQDLQSEFQIICSRVRELDESKIRIYWVHDLPDDPECNKLKDHNFRSKFHKIVYVSNWQYNMFREKLGIPYSENDIVIENGITPLDKSLHMKKKVNIIYTSTPQRGLGILVPVFEKLAEHFSDDIHLNVFSSFRIYGWEDSDKHFQALYDKCNDHKDITYHGFAQYETVREYLSESDIFAYPCIWQETSCRAMIEAMSAGLLCVHPNFAALPDTSGGLNLMYQGDSDHSIHANIFLQSLHSAIMQIKEKKLDNYLNYVKTYTDTRYNITKISNQWEWVMRNLLSKYDTVESRKLEKDFLVFKI